MNTRVILISGIILASLGIVATYYSQGFLSETDEITMTHSGTTYSRKTNVPLYVYSSFARSSRKWNSFYDRSHEEPKSDLITLCDNTHNKNHHIGKIIQITDEDLLKICPVVEKEGSPPISLQHNRVLRDILLLMIVCKSGGILIPRNTILMENTEYLYTQAQEPGTILHAGSGNDEYGCPVFVSNGSCAEVVDILLNEAKKSMFRGGVMFGGGLPTVLDRTQKFYPKIHTISGVREMSTHEFLKIGEYSGRDLVIRIQFPQASGVNTIPNKDEWVYSTSFGDLMMNPTVLRSIALCACNKDVSMIIPGEDV
jgi:hypothetical protein